MDRNEERAAVSDGEVSPQEEAAEDVPPLEADEAGSSESVVPESGTAPADTTEPGAPPPPDLVPPPSGLHRRTRGFLKDLWKRLEEGDIFFMAGAIAFNLIIVVIPLFLLAVGIAGFILEARFPDSTAVITRFLLDYLPAVGGDVELVQSVERVVQQILAERTSFGLVGALFFIWISTRLVGTLRTVLRNVFDVPVDRGIVRGKIFDAQIVVIGGMLMTINLGITIAVEAFQRFGMDLVGLEDRGIMRAAESAVADILAFLSIWFLFLLVYHYLPRRLPPWRTAIIAATVTAVFFEAMKLVFAWYATDVADYSTAYGNLTTVAILFFWIYYGSVVFIFGGHVAQVSTLRRQERLQWMEWNERTRESVAPERGRESE
ncbi:MAG: YihY/virulence factor BrkB family protein [Gemmatimonadota bacterium]